ncbi:carbohydrate ABC transporter permease [Mycoplasma sp. 'Moose RK']|uniref:carbohydrate ABC transporter permease n=1 Tax=Mycoplasma sp. 'Moose RK' TaxID=2780095 RepID=UPI0018C2AF12|nr:carbohydrate ABC transporter permease [Mycoplasma sp. 'Moose RK']MBG0731090.1 carbohydrate ABC transporter permease [Mycoplasma sp. 'Moose RK']
MKFKFKINFQSLILQFLLFLALSFVLIIVLFPLYYLILNASLPDELQDNPNSTLKISGFLWKNFLNSINENFWNGLKTSFLVILLINVIRLILYSMASLGLWIATKRVKLVFISLFVLLSFVPEISIYVPLAQILNKGRLITNFPVFSLISNQIFSFFNFFYLYKSVTSVKKRKLFLAKVDNLSIFSKIRLVIFPKVRIAYYLMIIFTTIQCWNDFLWPSYILANRSFQTISTWFQYSGQTSLGFLQNVQAAGALFAVVVPLFFYLIFSRFINNATAKNVR